jgi:hypothetical protein
MRTFAICNRPHFSLFGAFILLQPLSVMTLNIFLF